MPERDPHHWAPFEGFNPADGTVVREPPGEGRGNWAGAAGVAFDKKLERFHMVYRIRRPRGAVPDRGAEIRIAHGRDGILFEDFWSATKEQIDAPSLGRCCLTHMWGPGWGLYVSYVNPQDNRWQIGLVEAKHPDAFDLTTIRPVLTPAEIAAEAVRDPYVFHVAGLYHMVVSYATATTAATPEQLHGTQDVYSTGLVQTASGLATSEDGVAWQWEGQILGPNVGAWDGYMSRIATIWHRRPVWMALYDGSSGANQHGEERSGLAFSADLRTFHRVTRTRPLFQSPDGSGAVRYFDVIPLSTATYFYYEISRPDGSHELRVYRTGHGE